VSSEDFEEGEESNYRNDEKKSSSSQCDQYEIFDRFI